MKGNIDIMLNQVNIDELCIQTIRFLSADIVQKAASGHPGMPLGMAPAAYVLWTRFLRNNPSNPHWFNRDRFVLSCGHGCVLLYAMQHLMGFDISMDELQKFRRLGSKTPGHPEYDMNSGIEVTTGPLGQGISNAVGMAIAQKYLAAYFNRPGFELFNYKIYVFASDGDMEEGISYEACSLAGHLGLDNLVVIYDDNKISIDGSTSLSFTEDITKRFEACGFAVHTIDGDGTDIPAIENAIGQTCRGKPALIKLRTEIGYGSPHLQGSEKAHCAPLGEEEIRLMKHKYGWDPDKSFVVPPQVYEHFRKIADKQRQAEQSWKELFTRYQQKYPDLAGQIKCAQAGGQMNEISKMLPSFKAGDAISTRTASGKILAEIMPKLPLIMGGSADLTSSNNTRWPDAKDFQKNSFDGRYLRFGVREHAAAAIVNGISLSRLVRAYSGSYLVFSDYMRPAIRLAAMSKYPSIFVLTHDSISVGEDGTTHQPVEQLACLRAIPNLLVFRPADANETAECWRYILEHPDLPSVLLLSKQPLPVYDRTKFSSTANAIRGGYALLNVEKPDAVVLSSGSEVSLAIAAAEKLAGENIRVQVVNMICEKLFEQQSQTYKNEVLLPKIRARVAIEAGIEMGWRKYIGEQGVFIGMSTFGTSAPGQVCYEKFGITTQAVVLAVKKLLNQTFKNNF
jgi:transketolase